LSVGGPFSRSTEKLRSEVAADCGPDISSEGGRKGALIFEVKDRSGSEDVLRPKPGIASSTLIGSGEGEDSFTSPGAFAVSESRLASPVSESGSSMLLKKSSTLTADADDLAERSVPVSAETVDDTKT
jgi:hypothetical protein